MAAKSEYWRRRQNLFALAQLKLAASVSPAKASDNRTAQGINERRLSALAERRFWYIVFAPL